MRGGLRVNVNVRITCISVWEPRRHCLVFLKHNKYRAFLKQVTIFPDASFCCIITCCIFTALGEIQSTINQTIKAKMFTKMPSF